MAPDDNAPPHQDETAAAADGGSFGMRAPTFGEIAHELLDNGYEPIPIRPGSKLPAPRHGRACKSTTIGSIVGPDGSARAGWASAPAGWSASTSTSRIPTSRMGPPGGRGASRRDLMRVGRWPKRLLLYRTDSPSRRWRSPALRRSALASSSSPSACTLRAGSTAGRSATPRSTRRSRICRPSTATAARSCSANWRSFFRSDRNTLAGPDKALPARPQGPARDEQGRVVDGRDGWLSTIAYHAVHDAVAAGADRPDPGHLAAAVWERFAATADLDRPAVARRALHARRCRTEGCRQAAAARAGQASAPALPAVEIDYRVPDLTAEAAREQLEVLLGTACARIAAWHRRPGRTLSAGRHQGNGRPRQEHRRPPPSAGAARAI